jgi:Na+/H+-dicarboxylate symporter
MKNPESTKNKTGIRSQKILLIITLALFTIAAFCVAGNYAGFWHLPAGTLLAARLTAIAVLIAYAFKKRSLTTWILVGMLIGAELGYDLPDVAVHMRVFSLIFLRLIKTIIAPLLFATLVVGIAGHSNLKQVGRMGIKSLLYFEIITTIALLIGMAAINISQAGAGITLPQQPGQPIQKVEKQTATDIIVHIFPENIAKAIAEGQVLQVVIFAVLFGIALALIPETKRKPLLSVMESLSVTMFKFTNIVMQFAPIGVGAAIAYTVGHMGLGILTHLFTLLLTFYAALISLILLVFLPVALIVKAPIKKFISAVAEPAAIAFATTSSEAALPRAMEAMEGIGVPRKIVAFVIPTGYSFNLDGSSLYLTLAAIFVAQAAGRSMSFGEQFVLVLTLMLTSKGVAGVPRASLVILMGTVAQFNLPVEPVFILLGIDELMDMGRTAINVIGNSLATIVIARWEHEFGL